MCKITIIQYSCRHRIKHTWSACRGQVKTSKDSNTPACLKTPILVQYNSSKCGSCTRAEVEQAIRSELNISDDQAPSTAQQAILQERIVELHTQIPTSNWRSLPSPSYGRKPRQRRSRSPRRGSLLRDEVKPEDACGPAAWESNVVPAAEGEMPVYEAVSSGWDYEWTSETKSLADELAEDRAARGEDGDEGQDDQDEEEDDQAEAEEAEDSRARRIYYEPCRRSQRALLV